MPQPTKTQTAAQCAAVAEVLSLTATFLEAEDEDDFLDDMLMDSDDEEFGYDSEDDELGDMNEDIDELVFTASQWASIAAHLRGDGTRGPYGQIVRSEDFFATCLQAPDREFRHMFRVGRDTFDRLVALLGPMPLFESGGRRPQRHVKYQLAAFLLRYGLRGTDVLWVSRKLSIGFGTVILYCRRVSRALRMLEARFVRWPNAEEKRAMSDRIEQMSGFPMCIGSCDGSLFRFVEEPEEFGHVYKSRKKFFGTNVQMTVDDRKRITSCQLGWPASVTDAKIFVESWVWKSRDTLFHGGEYILADKGYPSSPYVVRPFSETDIGGAAPGLAARMREFNRRLSSVRIVSEHAYGALKGRFPGLKDLGTHRNIQDVYKAIRALVVIHNICIDWEDKPEYIWDFKSHETLPPRVDGADGDANEDEDCGEVIEEDADLKTQGHEKRMALLDFLFPE